MRTLNFGAFHIRKWYLQVEDTLAGETGAPADGEPLRKFVLAACIHNPYAGRYEPDLSAWIEGSVALGQEFGRRIQQAANGQAIESYGKAILVGTDGEYEHGNALLTRWPVVNHQHEDISDHRFEQRGLLHVEITVADRPLHVIVVHLGLIPGSRVRQVEQLRRFIAREVRVSEPLIVAGDFNEFGGSLSRTLRHDGLIEFEAARHPTFPSRLPLAQLDHIYARGLAPISAQVPHDRAWARMSDHLPLITEFRF